MASEGVWRHYHARLSEITRGLTSSARADSEDPCGEMHAAALVREAQHEELRREVRALVAGENMAGPFLIPV